MDETNLKQKVFMAARDYGINSVIFRHVVGRKLGLNVTDSECMSLLTIKGTSTAKELSRYTGLTTGATTTMLDRLEKRGFINRKPNPNDRRGVLVEINKKYTQKASLLVANIQKDNNKLINNYSDKELEIVANFLSKFSENIIQNTTKIDEKSL